MFTVTFSYN